MQRSSQSDSAQAFEQLLAAVPDSQSIDEAVQQVAAARRHSEATSHGLDRYLVEELVRLRKALVEAHGVQRKLSGIVERLTAPPWHAATFLDFTHERVARVLYSGRPRCVTLAEGLDGSPLVAGDEVLLSHELNAIVALAPVSRRTGTIATFDRYTDDGRIVLRARDEEIVVEAAPRVEVSALKPGDPVRWDADARMVFERLNRPDGAGRFLEDTPAETFELVGGLDRQIAELQRSIRLHLYHPEIAREYGVRRKGSVLLVGPPGTGKTMLAKALANWVGQISASGRSRFLNVKPAGLHEMWYGKSEENYREAFRVAREAGAAEPDVPVVMFFDEVDAVGAVRGGSFTRTDDRVLNALMAELDGLEARGNVLVVAATNRRDALDPALLRPGRLGDLELEVPRPNIAAAREIFSRYLPANLPYGDGGASGRQAVIAATVSHLYAPNADNTLATLTFRDGKQRVVRGADLMSGASIAKIAGDAVERVALRRVDNGEPAVRVEDLHDASDAELDRLARSLTPASCRAHLADLPADVDVVRVEPARRLVRRHRYVVAA